MLVDFNTFSTERFTFMRNINRLGIRVAFYNINDSSILEFLKHPIYWKTGVFLDSRCSTDDHLKQLFNYVSKNFDETLGVVF